jgi:hypothetical protein
MNSFSHLQKDQNEFGGKVAINNLLLMNNAEEGKE